LRRAQQIAHEDLDPETFRNLVAQQLQDYASLLAVFNGGEA
jgi:hypothetical protein